MRTAVLGIILLGCFVFLGGEHLASPTSGEAGSPGSSVQAAGEVGAPAIQAAAEVRSAAQPGEPHGEEDHEEGGHSGGHGGPVVPVLLGLVIILAGSKLVGEVLERIGQPAVLGELIAGILLGNLSLLGFHGLDFLASDLGLEILAQLGVILLLFEVGLESNVREMLSVGASSLVVAVLGVVAPFILGFGVSAWMIPQHDHLVHLFIGATLCATSVGITARVLTDLGKTQARETKIILGAAVIDDVLGLVILAVVSGIITASDSGKALALGGIALIVLKAVVFLVGAILVGGWLSPKLFYLASRLRIRGMLLSMALIFVFTLSYLADLIGLATIVGAFAAGLVLDEVHYRDHFRQDHTLEDSIHPISTFLVPIFFVWTGIRVDLGSFGRVEILGFALLLSLAAVVGKMVCAGGVLEKGLDRLSVAVGMVPRGEVGLIFAGIGASLIHKGDPVIDPSVFAAVVIMVIVTTLMTPPVLKLTLDRGDRIKARRASRQAADAAPGAPSSS